jgi:hypothetical protein
MRLASTSLKSGITSSSTVMPLSVSAATETIVSDPVVELTTVPSNSKSINLECLCREIESRALNVFSRSEHKCLSEYLARAIRLGKLSHYQEFVAGLLSENRLSNWNKEGTSTALSLSSVFLAALPDLPESTEIKLLQNVAVEYQRNHKSFAQFIVSYSQLIKREGFSGDKQRSFRMLLNLGIGKLEDPLTFVTEFDRLLECPGIQSSSNHRDLISFFRGLILNDWDFINSIRMLADVMQSQKNPVYVLNLVALSSHAGNVQTRSISSSDRPAFIPPALDYLVLGETNVKELSIASRLYDHARQHSYDPQSASMKLFAMFEISKFTNIRSSEIFYSKLEKSLLANKDPSQLFSILMTDLLRSTDSFTTRRAIENLISSRDLQSFQLELEKLRSIYNADVPDFTVQKSTDRSHGQNFLHEQTLIFKQAMNAFADFQQARCLISLIAPEIIPAPGDSPGLLAKFGLEVGDVDRFSCKDGDYPGSGIIIKNIKTENIFDLELNTHAGVFQRYLEVKGWSNDGIQDFLASRILIAAEMIIISVSKSPKYTYCGIELSAVFFGDGPGNVGRSQCFLVPTEIIETKLSGCCYSYWDSPDINLSADDLSTRDFSPEAFVISAKEAGLPVFDVGSPTNIGGFSNAGIKMPTNSAQLRSMINNMYGIRDLDPWGNLKKNHLFDKPEQFANHKNVHQPLSRIVSGFADVLNIFSDRYSAFKRGDTPDNSLKDAGYLNSNRDIAAGMLMVEDAYQHHCYLHQAKAKPQYFPKIRFYQKGSLQSGAVRGFELDSFDMKLTLSDQTIQLPTMMDRKSLEVNDDLISIFTTSADVVEAWQLYVRPHLTGLIPFRCFD